MGICKALNLVPKQTNTQKSHSSTRAHSERQHCTLCLIGMERLSFGFSLIFLIGMKRLSFGFSLIFLIGMKRLSFGVSLIFVFPDLFLWPFCFLDYTYPLVHLYIEHNNFSLKVLISKIYLKYFLSVSAPTL